MQRAPQPAGKQGEGRRGAPALLPSLTAARCSALCSSEPTDGPTHGDGLGSPPPPVSRHLRPGHLPSPCHTTSRPAGEDTQGADQDRRSHDRRVRSHPEALRRNHRDEREHVGACWRSVTCSVEGCTVPPVCSGGLSGQCDTSRGSPPRFQLMMCCWARSAPAAAPALCAKRVATRAPGQQRRRMMAVHVPFCAPG